MHTYNIPMGMQTYEPATMNIGHSCMTKQTHTFLYTESDSAHVCIFSEFK